MTSSTIPSAYGPLATSKDIHSFKFRLPTLQFDDSDRVIKLGHKPECWLLVHAEVLRRTFPLLAPGISDTWNGTSSAPEDIMHPRTQLTVPVRTKALKVVDGTFLLEGKEGLTDDALETDSADPFSESTLAPPGWEDIEVYSSQSLRLTRRSLTILIAFLYGARLEFRLFPEQVAWHECDHMAVLVTVCAAAEFWNCLELIRPRIISVLKSSPAFWECLGDSPKDYLILATKLEDADIYRDALRHMVAKAHWRDRWNAVADVTGWNETELRDFYVPQLEELGPKTRELREELKKLQLGFVRAKYWGGGWHDAYMRLIDLLPVVGGDTREKREMPNRVRWLGGAMLSEYPTSQISGERMMDRECRVVHAGSLSLAIHNITQAARSPNPSYLFDAAAPVHLAKWFKLSKRETRQLQQYLDVLVRKLASASKLPSRWLHPRLQRTLEPWARRALKTSRRMRLTSAILPIEHIMMGTTTTSPYENAK